MCLRADVESVGIRCLLFCCLIDMRLSLTASCASMNRANRRMVFVLGLVHYCEFLD